MSSVCLALTVCAFVLCISVCNIPRENGYSRVSFCNNFYQSSKFNANCTFSENATFSVTKYATRTPSITDSKFFLFFKEEAPLLFFLDEGVNGLSWTGYIYLRFIFGLCYACFVYQGSRHIILCRILFNAYGRPLKRSRRLCHYLAS